MAHRIEALVPARPVIGGRGRRVVGSTDARGQGTEFPIHDVGPFVLVDDVRGIEGPGQPPFGAHPHSGLVALSYAAEGGPWRSRANVAGAEELTFGAGDVLMTNAGRGAVHEEVTDGEGDHAMTQIILRLPAARRRMGGAIRPVEPIRLGAGVLRLFDERTLVDTGLDAVVYHCHVPAGGWVELMAGEARSTGFLFTRGGMCGVAGRTVPPEHVAVLAGGAPTLLVEGVEGPCDLLVGLATPIDEPWAKLLGHDGFVVDGDEAGAEAKLAEYAADPEGFGQR